MFVAEKVFVEVMSLVPLEVVQLCVVQFVVFCGVLWSQLLYEPSNEQTPAMARHFLNVRTVLPC